MTRASAAQAIRPSATRSDAAAGRSEQVLDAAASVFARQGYDATSVDDIADELGSTKGRIYHYYRSKADLLLGVLTAGATKLIEAVRPIAGEPASPSDRLLRMCRTHAMLLMSDNDYQRVALRSLNDHVFQAPTSRRIAWESVLTLRDEYESLFVTVVGEGVATGEFRSADVRLTVRGLLGALNWITVWYRPSATDTHGLSDPRAVADELAHFVVAGARGQRD